MKPIKIDKEFIWTRNGETQRVTALGILPEGIYIETKKLAKVSGRLIREFAPWSELEPVHLDKADTELLDFVHEAYNAGYRDHADGLPANFDFWVNTILKIFNINL